MDGKEIILAIITGLVALVQVLGGFIVKDMKVQIDTNRKEIADAKSTIEAVRSEMYLKYPTKQDLKDVRDELKEDNEKMDKKLDSIIDKIGARRIH